MVKCKLFALLTGLLIGWGMSSQAIAQTAIGGVQCSSLGGLERSNDILFAAIQPTSQGYDLLIVDDIGKYIFTLRPDLTISDVSSIQGQALVPWNLTAYDGSPISLNLQDGRFSIEMMVSTHSFCSFQGQVQVLQVLDDL